MDEFNDSNLLIFSRPLAVKRDIVLFKFLLGVCACVSVCMRKCVRICPGNNFYIYAWNPKYFGILIVLEEEKCHFIFFSGSQVEGQIMNWS